MTTIKIHNVETGEEFEREMTPAELEQYEKEVAQSIAEQAAKEEKAAKRTALLEKLGISEEEAKVLLG